MELSATVSTRIRFLAGALIIALSLYFLAVNAHFFALEKEDLGKYFGLRFVLLAHIAGGGTALLSGPFQFSKTLRRRHRLLHRRLGMAYVVAIAISGPCALVLTFTTARELGWPYVLSLQAWVSVWMVSTWLAYRYARLARFDLHAEWTTRSYLVTLAFVISALLGKLPGLMRLGSFAEISPSLFWAGWSIPLFVFDVALSARRKR